MGLPFLIRNVHILYVVDMVRNESVTYVELFFVRHNVEINDAYFTKEYLENR